MLFFHIYFSNFHFFYLVGLYIDGIDVQYWKRIDFSHLDDIIKKDNTKTTKFVTAKFYGFKKNVNEIRSFVFSNPTVQSSNDYNNLINENEDINRPLGSIHVIFYEAKVENGIYDNQNGQYEVPNQNTHQISDKKKFFEQATVTTIGGKLIDKTKEPFNPLTKWSNKSNEPSHSMTLYYHSKMTIDLLNNIEIQNNNVNNKRKYNKIIDLTNENENESNIKSQKNLNNQNESESEVEVEDDELQVLPLPPKIIPCYNLIDENNPQITQIIIHSNAL